jgi:hypothetical protein
MSTRKSKALAVVERIMTGHFKGAGGGKKMMAKQQAALSAAGLGAKVGYILHAGRVKDGTFQVQFNVGGEGWSSRWPNWAYEPARDSLLHGKKVWVIYDGAMPFGPNLLQVLIFPYRA